jgi:predicted Zn finger-like uncharacterized protein
MIITCPACSRRYLTEEDSLGEKGRTVKCAACNFAWFQEASEDISSLDFLAADSSYNQQTPQRSLKKQLFKWFVFLGFVTILSVGLYSARTNLLQTFPNLSKLYEFFGVSFYAPPTQLFIENIEVVQLDITNPAQIVIKGEIKNTSDDIQQIPALNIIIEGNCAEASWTARMVSKFKNSGVSCILDRWQHEWAETRLSPGEILKFETQPRENIFGMQNVLIEF